MKIYKYNKGEGYKYRMCVRCCAYSRCCQHHIDRRGTDRVVWICDKCHSWVHSNPLLAKEVGLYNDVDGVYRPKKKSPKKWKLKKVVGYVD